MGQVAMDDSVGSVILRDALISGCPPDFDLLREALDPNNRYFRVDMTKRHTISELLLSDKIPPEQRPYVLWTAISGGMVDAKDLELYSTKLILTPTPSVLDSTKWLVIGNLATIPMALEFPDFKKGDYVEVPVVINAFADFYHRHLSTMLGDGLRSSACLQSVRKLNHNVLVTKTCSVEDAKFALTKTGAMILENKFQSNEPMDLYNMELGRNYAGPITTSSVKEGLMVVPWLLMNEYTSRYLCSKPVYLEHITRRTKDLGANIVAQITDVEFAPPISTVITETSDDYVRLSPLEHHSGVLTKALEFIPMLAIIAKVNHMDDRVIDTDNTDFRLLNASKYLAAWASVQWRAGHTPMGWETTADPNLHFADKGTVVVGDAVYAATINAFPVAPRDARLTSYLPAPFTTSVDLWKDKYINTDTFKCFPDVQIYLPNDTGFDASNVAVGKPPTVRALDVMYDPEFLLFTDPGKLTFSCELSQFKPALSMLKRGLDPIEWYEFFTLCAENPAIRAFGHNIGSRVLGYDGRFTFADRRKPLVVGIINAGLYILGLVDPNLSKILASFLTESVVHKIAHRHFRS